MSRTGKCERKTAETDIRVEIDLDGKGRTTIETGIGFFDHVLTALGQHAGYDLNVSAIGDLHIDGHHTVEDTGIALGKAFDQALKDRRGIQRFGHAYCPLDEALARTVIDISGRGFLTYQTGRSFGMIGEFDSDLYEEFLRAFAINARLCCHADLIRGKNAHHCLEALAKSLARALRMATSVDTTALGIPSTKGVLV